MKKLLLMGLFAVLAMIVMPSFAKAEVQAGAGNLVLLGHIDFVARYSAEDKDEGWYGYETYNLEHAVLGVAGKLGDNVDWVMTYAFAFTGPFGPIDSASNAASSNGWMNNDAGGRLLDARIDWHLADSLTLSAGRFIPPTSMTWAPHLMKVLHTINYPLINNGGLNPMMLPTPMYQTGVMLTGKISGLSIMVGNFNGSEIVGGPDISGINILGLDNTMDIDKTKGTVAKVAYDGSGIHVGGWYYGEEVGINYAGSAHGFADGKLDQWGAEFAYESESIIAQAQYLSSTLDLLDSDMDDNLVQDGWYILLGYQADAFQVVARYDTINYDQDEVIMPDDFNNETATTLGVNYLINPNTTLGVNYTWRDLEGVDANTDELALILETNLF